MIDINILREQPKKVKENIKKKFQDDKIVDDVLKLDEDYRKELQQTEQLRHKRNNISKEISEAKKQEKDVKKILKEAKSIPDKIKKIEEKAEKLKQERDKILNTIPNIMHESVPIGKDETGNKVLKKEGKIRKFDFPVKNHVELLETNDFADFESSAKISGNGFYFLKGDLALLNQALINFAIDFMQKKGYVYIEPPLMIYKQVLSGALDTEEFKNTIYEVTAHDLAMIGTSEHPLLGMLADKAIQEKEVPLKLFSYSMCFRKEVGAHGINEKGLWRTHQFNKVEQFVFCKPEESYDYFNELLANSEELMKELGLPYRVLEMCSGDLSAWKAKQIDIEVYRPTTKNYGEVGSLSNCTDYQARNLNIKYINPKGERIFLHTLNNTAIATSRILVAILENYQQKDGKIEIPKSLRHYMNGKKIIGKK